MKEPKKTEFMADLFFWVVVGSVIGEYYRRN